jgi:cobalt-zinc-cadmium efflux system membrane fusion protein
MNINTNKFIKQLIFLMAGLVSYQIFPAYAGEGHDHSQEKKAHESTVVHAHDEDDEDGHSDAQTDHHEDGHEEEKNSVTLSEAVARESGVREATANAGAIRETLLLYGKVMPDPQHISHIKGRYPGVITRVDRLLGDAVKAGESLLEVEANDSLVKYNIKSPISGVVVESHANVGELAGDLPLLTVANYDKVWIVVSIFSKDTGKVKTGQTVIVQMEDQDVAGNVAYINPGSGETPYLLAGVPLDNASGYWVPGMMTEVHVVVAETPVNLRIDNRSLQDVRGQRVVFVKTDQQYVIRPLTLGKTDGAYTEVLSGLQSGETYVVDNSYLLKADLEKSSAAHEH